LGNPEREYELVLSTLAESMRAQRQIIELLYELRAELGELRGAWEETNAYRPAAEVAELPVLTEPAEAAVRDLPPGVPPMATLRRLFPRSE